MLTAEEIFFMQAILSPVFYKIVNPMVIHIFKLNVLFMF